MVLSISKVTRKKRDLLLYRGNFRRGNFGGETRLKSAEIIVRTSPAVTSVSLYFESLKEGRLHYPVFFKLGNSKMSRLPLPK